jgi:peptide/nickel transport system substrate-binding protein
MPMRLEKPRKNRAVLAVAVLAIAAMAGLPRSAGAETMLRIGMTAADIPRTSGQPDQGYEGNRFTGVTMYDSLTMWDLSSADKASGIIPGLATEWKVNDDDHTKWLFKLRSGVKFHDGSPFNADAVVWNVDKVLNQNAPQFDASQVGLTTSRMPTLVSARKIDDLTVEMVTKEPDSFLPINLTNLYMASPSKWQKLYDAATGADAKAKSQAAWDAFAKDASGTGPWKFSSFTPRERLELVKNADYWDKARIPHIDKMLLLPMPEANARTAALLSGQVDWIEAPAPDALAQIKQRGFVLYSNEEPHVWPWQFSRVEGSPWNDIRVRKAANLCIDRDGLKDGLLGGLMVPATGTYEVGHPWHGNPTFLIKYDKSAAQKLMQEAGYGPNKHLAVKVQTSASGSGQMLPIPMNEYLQQALAECYFDVQIDVIEWNTLLTNWRRGAKDPSANGANATNVTYSAMDPFFSLVRFLQSSMAPPVSNNWGYINNPKFDALVTKARQTFDPAARDIALAELHAASVDDAAFLYVAHDVAPRALSPKFKGFVQPRSWLVDFSPVTMTP